MKLDAMARRMFLTGSGVALALPFLHSLLPRSARASVPGRPVRYVQVVNPYGATTAQFYGSLAASEQVAPNVATRALSDVAGPISAIIGPELSALRDRFSLLHGLDVMSDNDNHQMCAPTCASSYQAGVAGDEVPPVAGQPSVDMLLAGSDKVYDASTPTLRRALVLNPVQTDDYTATRSFSWRPTPGGLEMVRPTKTTVGVHDLLAGTFPGPDAQDGAVLDAVYDDYRQLRDSTRLSASDRDRLEGFMTLVSELEQPGGSCPEPALRAEPDADARIDNQLRLITAALACGSTRVVSLVLGTTDGETVRHDEHHRIHTPEAEGFGLYADLVQAGRRVARLLAMLDDVDDADGTLLDNSIVYWSMQYGNALEGDAHSFHNLPVLVGGGAGGQLRTGRYVDYRKDGHLGDDTSRGVPLNNLLVTFMRCMGLGPTDWERPGSAGYGYYHDRFLHEPSRADFAHWLSTAGRRSALPYLYQGPDPD